MARRPIVIRVSPELAALAEQTRQKRNDAARGTSTQRGYGGGWPRLRKSFIKANPLCRHCLDEGNLDAALGSWAKDGRRRMPNEVDHMIPIAVAPELRLDGSNLQTLCSKHHKRKTALESPRFAAGGHQASDGLGHRPSP